MIAVLLVCVLAQVPDAIKNEPSAEKRFQLAFDHAAKVLAESRDVAIEQRMKQATETVELGMQSLEAMGRKPYQNARNYKRAELRVREVLRRADALRKEAPVDDRPALEDYYERINAVHEKLLEGVMSKKP